MTDIKKCLENIKTNAEVYTKTTSKKGIEVPEDVLNTLVKLYKDNKNQKITVPVKPVNEAIGFKGNLERQRALQIKQKINNQFGDKLSDKEFYHVGSTEQGTKYIFFIGKDKEE